MRLFHRGKHVPNTEGIIKARHARIESEARLSNAFGLIQLLREMREENHITDDVRRAIEQRIEQSGR